MNDERGWANVIQREVTKLQKMRMSKPFSLEDRIDDAWVDDPREKKIDIEIDGTAEK